MEQLTNTVLVVDDDPTIVAGYQRGFERDGCVVHAATTAAAAAKLADKYHPQLAVVDLRIGADWGIELIRQLKQDHPALRVVLVSGYLSVASAVGAMHAGADEVVYKPVTSRQILRLLDEPDPTPPEPLPTLAEVHRDHVLRVLAASNGNISEAARQLGMHRQSLQRFLRRTSP